MSKWFSVEVEDDMHAVFQDESIRLSRESGKRVPLAVVIKDGLEREKQRLKNKHKRVNK